MAKSMANQNTCRSLLLVIPTLEERNTLRDAIHSAVESMHLFHGIIVSVNGKRSDRARAIISEAIPNNKVPIWIYCTGKKLTATKHSSFILHQLRAHAKDATRLLLLADDDLLGNQQTLTDYANVACTDVCCTVGMGRFKTFTDRLVAAIEEKQHVGHGERIGSTEFLKREGLCSLFTSISSMIIPYHIFRDSLGFMGLLSSSGRRCEYILATHRSVTSLYSPSEPTAFIRIHPNQEGRTLSLESYYHDELVYTLWVWLNQPVTRPWSKGHEIYGHTGTRFARTLASRCKLMIQRLSPSLYKVMRRTANLLSH